MHVTRRFKLAALIVWFLPVAGCAAPANTSATANGPTHQAATNETLLVLRLDPKKAGNDAVDSSQLLMHGYPILARVDVSDPVIVHDVMKLLEQGFADEDVTAMRCFNPRHGVIHTTAGGTTEFVICFQCNNFVAYGAESNRESGTTSRVAKQMLDRLLRAPHADTHQQLR